MLILMIYALIGTALLPLALTTVLLGGLFKRGWYDGFAARFGYPDLPPSERPIVVWCASLGEVNTAQRLIRELLGQGPVVIACITPTGLARARELFGDAVTVITAPLDILFCALRWVKRVAPRLIVCFETELWPLTLRIAYDHGAKLALVNGRLSDRSFPRYRFLGFIMRPLLARFDLVAVQTEQYAGRFAELGAPPVATKVLGSLKFDVVPPTDIDVPTEALYRAFCAGRRVVVAGSTHPTEEKVLGETLLAVRAVAPTLALIVAPRHLKRADEVERDLRALGLSVVRRSTLTAEVAAAGDVLLLDTIGELTWAYSLAEVAFVGGSFTDAGGHNVLEPAASGVPVLVGPRTPNFRLEVEVLRENGAVRECATAAELSSALSELLRNEPARRAMGQAAASAVARHQGATARTAAALHSLLQD